ncbi:MAG TPA: hypothetical protein VES89_12600, partial [Candidatus Competibacteraceae bacterium]|nr:hypothetical protein [Candidatus Competibacteraceae bacterium]
MTDIAAGSDGSFYMAQPYIHRIRRVGPDGIITTVAGTDAACAPTEGCGDGGRATEARLNAPEGVTVGPDNSLYIA